MFHSQQQQQQQEMGSRKLKKTGSKAKKLPPFPALHLVTSLWALSFACLYAHFAYRAINHPSCASSSSPPCYRLPPGAAEAAEATALLRAHLWCNAPQAAAAALALLLPPGRRRRALALAALAATAVNHGVLARLLGLLRAAAPPGDGVLARLLGLLRAAAPPGDDVLLLRVAAVVTCVALVTDLLGFLAILIGGRED